jgi:hypothetical protein
MLPILNDFAPIALEEMDTVKLLDRVDTKFAFNICLLPDLLHKISPFYKMLEVDGFRLNRYETLYFDTPDFKLYTQHHNGKLNRYKIRYRQYMDSGLSFFEVKFRNNKGRTIKDRIKRKQIDPSIEGKAENLLLVKTPFEADQLQPKVWVYYSRITLVNMNSPERLTIDIDLHYSNGEHTIFFPGLVIAEVKQEKTGFSPFIKLMHENRIFSDSISKYCLGAFHLFPGLKKNLFKSKLTAIKKLCYDLN